MELHNFIGYAAAFLGMFTLLPQVIKTWKIKETKDISLVMYLMLWLGVALWLIYGILIRRPPVILVNTIVITLTSIMLFLKTRYK